jgi:hypothetical protein
MDVSVICTWRAYFSSDDTFVRFVSFVYFQSTKNINFLGDYPLAIPTKFGSSRTCGFREED